MVFAVRILTGFSIAAKWLTPGKLGLPDLMKEAAKRYTFDNLPLSRSISLNHFVRLLCRTADGVTFFLL